MFKITISKDIRFDGNDQRVFYVTDKDGVSAAVQGVYHALILDGWKHINHEGGFEFVLQKGIHVMFVKSEEN